VASFSWLITAVTWSTPFWHLGKTEAGQHSYSLST